MNLRGFVKVVIYQKSIKFCDIVIAKIMYLNILENTKQLPKFETLHENERRERHTIGFPKMEQKSSRIIKFSKSHKVNGA